MQHSIRLNKKSVQQQLQCCFNFPHPEQLHSTIEFEQVENGDICATSKTKRNDPSINSHNRLLIQHWNTNVDIQIIINAEMCARYMATYVSKGEPRSKPVSSIFKSCIDRLNSTSHAHTALCTVQFLFQFCSPFTTGSSWLTTDNHSEEQKIEKSLLQHYATCAITF